MELNINLDPNQINQAVADAIIKSAIGEQLEKVIKREVERLSGSYNNPIEPVVQQEIGNAIRVTVQEKYSEVIREKVAEKVTEQFTADLFEKMWDSFIRRY